MLFINPNTENLDIFKLSVYGEVVVPATRQANVSLYKNDMRSNS